jgi:phosphoribosylaminoimidazole carboxylase PurE protein
MSGGNASPIERSRQEMSGANASPIGRSHQEMSGGKPVVGIIMGSDSDLPTMQEAVKILKQFEIPYEIGVYSAHRSPQRTAEYVTTAQARGLKLIIAGAGSSAHLAGVTAAETTLPVIGVPIDSSPLSGFDALLSTVQMPPGVPVATMGVGKSGATNAGVFAVQILALTDEVLAAKLKDYKSQLEKTVAEKSKKIQESL